MNRHSSISSTVQPVRAQAVRSSSSRPTHDPREIEVLEDDKWKNLLGSIHTKMLLHVNSHLIRNTLLTRRIATPM